MTDASAHLPPRSPELVRLSAILPQWVLGIEEERTLAGLCHGLANLGARNPDLGREFAPIAAGLATWGVQAHPLCPDLAALAASVPSAPTPARRLGAWLHPRLAGNAAPPDPNLAELEPILKSGDTGLIINFLLNALRTSPAPLAILARSWRTVLAMGGAELPPAALAAAFANVPACPESLALKSRLEAEHAFHSLDHGLALERVRALDPDFLSLWKHYAEAELLIRSGHPGDGTRLLKSLLQAMPWHVNLALKLRSLLNPIPASSPSGKNAAILLYSWNKADLLARTLESLARSETGGALVAILDNGSDDGTSAILDRAGEMFGDRFLRVDLPVNVGAPAARNWLLSLPEVREREWFAFLDDDVVLPPDWLARLMGAANSRPGLGAVGCRISSASEPRFLQSADYNMHPFGPDQASADPRVQIMDICSGRPDTGMFAYDRPALSVSGCCHLISRQAVDAAGGFDVRFTPSQFDDLDRDLRSALAGFPAFYLGGLRVGHVQFSSLAKAETPAKMGHVLGNKLKLDAKYSRQDLERLSRDGLAMLWDDLLED